MHIHLDPVGGAAGDMFAAAILDLRPDLEADLCAALRTAGFASIVDVARLDFSDGVLSGSQFEVTPANAERHDDHHRPYKAVVALFTDAEMPSNVRTRALDIFRVLGEAEASVHGKALDDVVFHEVGAWDSIADVMSAAWLIEAIGADSWSCAPIPIGGGRVQSAHGELALPAPATTILLQGFPMHDDGRKGERVTPTGAAILKQLQPRFETLDRPMTLLGAGQGFGTKKLHKMSNVLRALAFEAGPDVNSAAQTVAETIAVCEFEVDDQTPEDLAVGLDHLRAMDAVLDVVQMPVFAKKGRMAIHVRVLSAVSQVETVIAACLTQTSTLGVRWNSVQRTSLKREEFQSLADGQAIRVKQVIRPDNSVTCKAEMADLAHTANTHHERERLRRDAESSAATHGDDRSNGTSDKDVDND
jgi:uncharacterized protein (TIGR00299 family) protein